MNLVLTLASALAAAAPQSPPTPTPQTPTPQFAAPRPRTAGGAPLGEKLLYPSPRLHDIDRDGRAELVVGDLRGQVLVAEKVGDDLSTWSALEPLRTDGRPLKFHNW
jgi:hypothetical protein